jgi:hypothetical protein
MRYSHTYLYSPCVFDPNFLLFQRIPAHFSFLCALGLQNLTENLIEKLETTLDAAVKAVSVCLIFAG